jgi:hypothetical protein
VPTDLSIVAGDIKGVIIRVIDIVDEWYRFIGCDTITM